LRKRHNQEFVITKWSCNIIRTSWQVCDHFPWKCKWDTEATSMGSPELQSTCDNPVLLYSSSIRTTSSSLTHIAGPVRYVMQWPVL
jgi:hypothetical protein